MIHNVPDPIKIAFKRRCFANDKTMREVIIEFLQKYAS